MTIDWLTASAQVVNFLVLVYLLKRFLYAPVMAAMQRRNEAIAERMRASEQALEVANGKAERYEKQRLALAAERSDMLAAARLEAEAQTAHLVDEARESVAEQKRRWESELAREQEALVRAAREGIAEMVTSIVRRVLGDLADETLESSVARVLLKRVQGLSAVQKQHLRDASNSAAPGLRIVTSFEPSPATRTVLEREIGKAIASDVRLDWSLDDALVCGVVLEGGGYRWTWSVDSYLDDTESALREQLSRHSDVGDQVSHAHHA